MPLVTDYVASAAFILIGSRCTKLVYLYILYLHNGKLCKLHQVPGHTHVQSLTVAVTRITGCQQLWLNEHSPVSFSLHALTQCYTDFLLHYTVTLIRLLKFSEAQHIFVFSKHKIAAH